MDNQTIVNAARLLTALDTVTSLPHHDELRRVLSLGIPTAMLISHDFVTELSEEGISGMNWTIHDVSFFAGHLRANLDATVRQCWDAVSAAKRDIPDEDAENLCDKGICDHITGIDFNCNYLPSIMTWWDDSPLYDKEGNKEGWV